MLRTIVILGSAAALAVLVFVVTEDPTGTVRPSPTVDTRDGTDAYVYCKNAVATRLSTPSTAKYSSFTESNVQGRGTSWDVRGWVDAQNAFGATVRSDYDCSAAYLGRDSWRLDNLTITPR